MRFNLYCITLLYESKPALNYLRDLARLSHMSQLVGRVRVCVRATDERASERASERTNHDETTRRDEQASERADTKLARQAASLRAASWLERALARSPRCVYQFYSRSRARADLRPPGRLRTICVRLEGGRA